MTAKHITLGRKGEQLAREYLTGKGYRIIKTNWRYGDDEVDMIAMDGDELVFIEVKTRSTDRYGNPEDDVSRQKESFLVRAAEAYIDACGMDVDSRFDIIAIILSPEKKEIFHIEDAFYPT